MEFAYAGQAQGGRYGLDLDDHRRTWSHGSIEDPKRRANVLARGEHARGGMRPVDRSQHHAKGVVGHAHELASVAGELGQFAPEHSGRRSIGGAARRGAAQRGAHGANSKVTRHQCLFLGTPPVSIFGQFASRKISINCIKKKYRQAINCRKIPG